MKSLSQATDLPLDGRAQFLLEYPCLTKAEFMQIEQIALSIL
jgi:hypothetical protein